MADGDVPPEIGDFLDVFANVIVEREFAFRESSRMAMTVKCFETDLTWKIDDGVIGMPYSRFASP